MSGSLQEVIVLIPSHGLEDFPTELGEKPAASLLNAFAVVWHPTLLAASEALPRWWRADDPPPAKEGTLIIIPTACEDLVPSGYVTQARAAGATIVEDVVDRPEMLSQCLDCFDENEIAALDQELVLDFLALGSNYLQLELLTRRMRNYSNFDELRLKVESVAAAKATINNDSQAARKHLKICFEMLLESRERFYPVELYLMDLCLLTPETWQPDSKPILPALAPINFLATAQAWESICEKHTDVAQQIKTGLEKRQVGLVGGDDSEGQTSLLPLHSNIWHLQQGRQTYQKLFDSNPRVWARKKFGLHAQMPQIISRSGYEAALHLLLDDGSCPEDEEAQMRWEGPDGSAIDTFSRIPLPADSARTFLKFSERMQESMDHDHIAALMFARWPNLKNPYFDDFRRASQYAPVLGQFVTCSEYFQQTTSAGRRADFKAAEYLSPSLIYSVAGEEPDPVSRHEIVWEFDRKLQQAEMLQMVALLIQKSLPFEQRTESLKDAEQQLRNAEKGGLKSDYLPVHSALDFCHQVAGKDLTETLTQSGKEGRGCLIFNTLAFPRTVLVEWPDEFGPEPCKPVLGQQRIGQTLHVLVELPPCGFVWIASRTTPAPEVSVGKNALAEPLLLKNDKFEVFFSETTGGIAQIKTNYRSPNRLSQQVARRYASPRQYEVGEGDKAETVSTNYTSMELKEHRVLSAGPLIGEIATLGNMVDDQTGEVTGTFRQWTRVIKGLGHIEVILELSPAERPTGNPWDSYLGCRFAWKHEGVALSGSMHQGVQKLSKPRIEAPQFIEIADDDFRTTLLFPGLPFHRKAGERMLDTILMTEGETQTIFRFAIAIDHAYPMQAHLNQFSRPPAIPTTTIPTEGFQTGWFFHVSTSNVQLQRIFPTSDSGKVVLRFLETEGRTTVFKFSSFLPAKSARQIDFRGGTIGELDVASPLSIEIAGYEICDVEIQF